MLGGLCFIIMWLYLQHLRSSACGVTTRPLIVDNPAQKACISYGCSTFVLYSFLEVALLLCQISDPDLKALLHPCERFQLCKASCVSAWLVAKSEVLQEGSYVLFSTMHEDSPTFLPVCHLSALDTSLVLPSCHVSGIACGRKTDASQQFENSPVRH